MVNEGGADDLMVVPEQQRVSLLNMNEKLDVHALILTPIDRPSPIQRLDDKTYVEGFLVNKNVPSDVRAKAILGSQAQAYESGKQSRTHEKMTGLLNRDEFIERCDAYIYKLVRSKLSVITGEIRTHGQTGQFLNYFLTSKDDRLDQPIMSVHIIDVNKLKNVNDNIVRGGHAMGDQLLRGWGEAIRTTFKRSSDISGRIGGDEGAVVSEIFDSEPEDVNESESGLTESFFQKLNEVIHNLGLQNGEGTSYVGVANYTLRHLIGILAYYNLMNPDDRKKTSVTELALLIPDAGLIKLKDDRNKAGLMSSNKVIAMDRFIPGFDNIDQFVTGKAFSPNIDSLE